MDNYPEQDARFVIVSRASVKPRDREKFRTLLPRLHDAAESEPGTLVYSIHAERENPDDYWIVEMYADHESHMFHRRNSVDSVRGSLEELFITWPHRRYCVPIITKGLGAG